MSKTEFGEMIDKIKIDTVFSIVLKKGGSTHNVVVKELGEKTLFGNVALERIIYMHDTKNKPKCEFGFCENIKNVLEERKDINIIEATRVFLCLPRIVIIPLDNIGLLEEGPFPFIESTNSIGTEIKIEDKLILDKFPIFKPYYSKEVGGFYQNPILIKKPSSNMLQFPKTIQGVNTIDVDAKEAKETGEENE